MVVNGGQISDYVSKPISREELRVAIQVALGLQAATRGLPARVMRMVLEKAGQVDRILVVEDKLINQLVVKRILEKRGHTVVVANDGRDALTVLDDATSVEFNCVLMDV